MLPARRPRVSSSSSAAAAAPRSGRGWLSAISRDPSKLPRRADDGTPLTDELLLVVFAGVPDIADLVRCAFTCRRWRRLVSAEAAFICRTPRRPPGRFIRSLALGFFHHQDAALAVVVAAAPWFVPTASAARRFPGLLQQPPRSLSTMVDDGLFNGSLRIVASRNGLLVVDLRHGKYDTALKLRVCNPMTGAEHTLPPLGGKDDFGYYACTVLTAEDEKTVDPPRASSYFRLIMIYTRREFTAFRTYSFEDGKWSKEAKVTDARLHKKQMGLRTHIGVVDPGGRLVYWLAKNGVFVLCLETLQSAVVSIPQSGNGREFDKVNTLLGMSPEGMLCAVQFGHLSLRRANLRVSIRITTCTNSRRWLWDMEDLIQVEQSLTADVSNVKLQWFCEKSGVVFFSAVSGNSSGHRRYEMYALSLKTRVVEKLVRNEGVSNPWVQVCGYEMDQAVYLASLAEPEGIEDM